MKPMILKLDNAGQALKWISWQSAATLYARDLIAWTAGEHHLKLFGGINHQSGRQSQLSLNSIIAIKGTVYRNTDNLASPPLTNRALFRRDNHLCLYCGKCYSHHILSRDHVMPLSRGGLDTWTNVVTACRQCNIRKAARTPEEARMPLLAVPFIPNHAEFLALSNRRMLTDQMAFLQKQFRKRKR